MAELNRSSFLCAWLSAGLLLSCASGAVQAESVRGVGYMVPEGHLSGRALLERCESGAMDAAGRRCQAVHELFDSFGGIDVWAFEIVVREGPRGGYLPVATLALEAAEAVSDQEYLDAVFEQFETMETDGPPPSRTIAPSGEQFLRMDVNDAYGAPGLTMSYLVTRLEEQRLIVLLPAAAGQRAVEEIPQSI